MSKTDHKPNIILVLGMHRSGTSLLAQLVSAWGANMGTELMPASEFNPDGYWEFKPLVDFHDKMFQESGNNWYTPANLPATEDLLKKYGSEARALVNQMDRDGKAWCWKDPRMPMFLDFWHNILAGRSVGYVVVYRHPFRIASSLYKRDQLPVSVSTSLWELTSMKIFKNLPEHSAIVVNYEKIIANPEDECNRLFRFLDKTTGVTEKTTLSSELLQPVKKSLNHEKSGIRFNINDFQKLIIESYQSGNAHDSLSKTEAYEDKLHQIFHLYKSQKITEHLTQIFWTDHTGAFSENCSIVRKIDVDAPVVSFHFSPAIIPENLRFDPINDFAWLRINAIRFFHQGKLVDLQYEISSNALKTEKDTCLFDTIDPQIKIETQNPDNKLIDEIRIDLKVLKSGSRVLPLITEIKTQQTEDQRRKFSTEINRLKKDFNQITNQQKEKIDQLSSKLESSRETISELRLQTSYIDQELSMIRNSRVFTFYKYTSVLLKPSGWKKIAGSLKRKIALSNDTRLIRKSKYFDENYYLQNNPDIKKLNISPARHYLFFGGFENRDPSTKFSSSFYLDQNPDVLTMLINPLVHYLKYGKKEGRLPLHGINTEKETMVKTRPGKPWNFFKHKRRKNTIRTPHFSPPRNDYSLRVPFAYKTRSIQPNPSIAVICHLYYTDLLEEIKSYLENIPYSFNLFITTDTQAKEIQIKKVFDDWKPLQVIVKVIQNRGRDIAPKLLAWPDVYKNHEFFLHIHSKKTIQEEVLSDWREYLYQTLIGSEDIVKSIFEAFNCDDRLGVIAPQHFQNIRHAIGWGWNFPEARSFARKLGIKIDPEGPVDFPSGSMFWARSAAIRPLLDSGITISDFPEEAGQIDNTLSHVIERLYFFVCEKAGYQWIKINSCYNKLQGERTITIDKRELLCELIALMKGAVLTTGIHLPKEGYNQSADSKYTNSNMAGGNQGITAVPLNERLRFHKLHIRSAYSHLPLDDFISEVKRHAAGKQSIIDFDEDFYRKANPDVSKLIATGLYDCGFTHYILEGQYENRLWSNNQISSKFNQQASYPDGMVKPVNIKFKTHYKPFGKTLIPIKKPYLLILFGHLRRDLFYAGYRAFFKDFDTVFPMFGKIVLSVENEPIEPELATQYNDRIVVIDQKTLYETDEQPDLIISFSNHMFMKARKLFGHPEKIIYYCQEFESGFFPYGTEYIEAEKAVAHSHNLIISTVILRNFLKDKGLLKNSRRVFVSSPEIKTFHVDPKKNKKLFFYFRPEYFHARNIPEIIWEAVGEFCSRHQNYELFLVGTIETRFSFEKNGNRIFVLSKLPNDEYVSLISSCDVVISMIYSAHPGVVAFQAAASGIPTVTNVFENRSSDYLRRISENIVPYDPVLENLTEKIEEAMQMSKGEESFRKMLYAGKNEALLTGFISEILNESDKTSNT